MKLLLVFLTILLCHPLCTYSQTLLNTTLHQARVSPCSTDTDCNEAFIFPVLRCVSGQCRLTAAQPVAFAPSAVPEAAATTIAQTAGGPAGAECTSFRDCKLGLICISGNPRGKCATPKGLLGLAHLVVNLIQEDYTPGGETDPITDVEPVQGGPLLTTRVIAIVFLSAHDAYAFVTGAFRPRLLFRPRMARLNVASARRKGRGFLKKQAEFAMLSAGLFAAKRLYPAAEVRINSVGEVLLKDADPLFVKFGELIAEAWLKIRGKDPTQDQLIDEIFTFKPFRHQPDPNFPLVVPNETQTNFGRVWKDVRPLVLRDVRRQAFLGPNPDGNSRRYRKDLIEVRRDGQCNNLTTPEGVPLRDIGIFWGYDSAPFIGTPPRLYLQVILAVQELQQLPTAKQLRALTAVSVAMFDAGIAAWLWKFEYDLWRPVLGIRRDTVDPDTDWDPVGVPLSNVEGTRPPECRGVNPNFPAYPSGHASFGTAAFRTLSRVLRKRASRIRVTFTSDEFNGVTKEGTTGAVRREFTQNFTLQQGIEQNSDARVFLGVHWRFDSEGGEVVGNSVAKIVARRFRL